MYGHLDHRRYERGRDSVSGDVCHQDAEVVVVRAHELVEVAGHGGHGMVRRGDTEF